MKHYNVLVISILLVFAACDRKKGFQSTGEVGISEPSSTYKNPVLPGDFADPSVVRVGKDYYATATSSEWAPLFPILHSTNLVNWEIVGHVFPNNLPNWAEAHFWAPEITYEDGKFYVYYTAKKKGGPLCTGVASANDAVGPYVDHGELICQDIGAIDGFPIRDEKNDLYLIWKEDGNSRRQPTPIWGQRMNEERTELTGEKFELFRNDPATWEGGLVEGVYLLKKGGYFYAFYSGDKCCGRKCTYGVGVARAKNLRGPWTKYVENPLIKQNEDWKCAGHGSLVSDKDGNDFFLYHAYSTQGGVYTGRQGLLDKLEWGKDQWPKFTDNAPSKIAEIRNEVKDQFVSINENFEGEELALSWQWPVAQDLNYSFSKEGLNLKALPESVGAILGQRTLAPDYTAEVVLDRKNLSKNTMASLAAVGNPKRAIGIGLINNKIILWKTNAKETVTISEAWAPDSEIVKFRLNTTRGDHMVFTWSVGGGTWYTTDSIVNGSSLPPWDRAVRVGLTVKGSDTSGAIFKSFRMAPE